MIKVMVTGAAGFLAHHLIKELRSRGYFIVGVDKRPIPANHELPDLFLQTDVNDLKFRDLIGIEDVYHFSWRTNIPDCSRHPEESTRDNIIMSIHMLEVAKEAKIKKFLFPSTASLYGNNPTPWTEDMEPQPMEPYSWQKLSCEYLLRMNARSLPNAIFRFFQVFGEYQREDTALAAFLRSKRENRPITLTETTA